MDAEWKERLIMGAQVLLEDKFEDAVEGIGPASRFQSPIELAFAVAARMLIRARYPEFIFEIDEMRSTELIDDQLHHEAGHWFKIWGIIAPQIQIGPYRVDFVIRHLCGLEGAAGVVIECDGHNFHERTKKQAAKDKERDRFLQASGYRVFRFSGSEIWADPVRCADDVLQFAFGKTLDSLNARSMLAKGDIDGMTQHLRYAMQ
jgi:very-short-patch-repair endonuclease